MSNKWTDMRLDLPNLNTSVSCTYSSYGWYKSLQRFTKQWVCYNLIAFFHMDRAEFHSLMTWQCGLLHGTLEEHVKHSYAKLLKFLLGQFVINMANVSELTKHWNQSVIWVTLTGMWELLFFCEWWLVSLARMWHRDIMVTSYVQPSSLVDSRQTMDRCYGRDKGTCSVSYSLSHFCLCTQVYTVGVRIGLTVCLVVHQGTGFSTSNK